MAPLRNTARLLLALALLDCAASREGGDATLEPAAPQVGWVDFLLSDFNVPADPIARLTGAPEQPPPCTLNVDFDGLPMLSERLWPTGASPPYSIESTFRFSASPGEHGTTVTYSGCRDVEGQLDSVRAEIRIAVRRGQVTQLRFDGSRLEVEFPRGNPAGSTPR